MDDLKEYYYSKTMAKINATVINNDQKKTMTHYINAVYKFNKCEFSYIDNNIMVLLYSDRNVIMFRIIICYENYYLLKTIKKGLHLVDDIYKNDYNHKTISHINLILPATSQFDIHNVFKLNNIINANVYYNMTKYLKMNNLDEMIEKLNDLLEDIYGPNYKYVD